MIRIAILEDESIAARNIERLLSSISFETEVVIKLESVKDAVETLPHIECDLILMDIHLLDGNAFQVFDQIELLVPIIFTTAYDKYALKAFKQNSIDYLLKPIKKVELQSAILKFKQIHQKENFAPFNYRNLQDFFRNRNYRKSYLVQIGKKMLPIRTEDIAYIYVDNKTIYFRTFEDKTYLSDFSLALIESHLNPDEFYRVNRQYLINFNSIENIYYESLGKLKVNCRPTLKEDVWVSIDKIGKFKKWLNR